VPDGVVAVDEVLELDVLLVGVVVLVEVLVDVDVEVLLEDELVGVDAVEDVCCRQFLRASRAIVLAPWVRFLRSVGLMVTGRVWTSRFSATLALTAAPQFPDPTAELIWSAWPLSAIDCSPESRPEPPPQATRNETAKPSPPARMARGA
jgi:hypothetical protein